MFCIYKLLKHLRLSKGYSQDYMAKKLGYKSKSGYCMLENGITKLTLHKAKLIAEILEVEPSIFFENHIQATSIYEIKNTTK